MHVKICMSKEMEQLKKNNELISNLLIIKYWTKWGDGYKTWIKLWIYVKYTALGTIGPKHCIRSQTPMKPKCPQLFVLKGIPATLRTKWGLVCKNLIWGCRVMPDKPFLAHLPQNQLLGPSLPIWLKFANLIFERCCP